MRSGGLREAALFHGVRTHDEHENVLDDARTIVRLTGLGDAAADRHDSDHDVVLKRLRHPMARTAPVDEPSLEESNEIFAGFVKAFSASPRRHFARTSSLSGTAAAVEVEGSKALPMPPSPASGNPPPRRSSPVKVDGPKDLPKLPPAGGNPPPRRSSSLRMALPP
mmetsp:Transcript_16892/g.49755  ORF Transcript_16892/g.49755 Transcript_16892/m.49755 type:complete len:166 (-) Transcript_16892:461-958(-)